MVLSRPQKMSAMVQARITERRSTTRPFSMNGISTLASSSLHPGFQLHHTMGS